ncbi:saccharopine dehydrogenase NADP-binding domain-containing protein [Weeksellaceae bacterium KMM 9724]|uniref:saccharopine dehydrogenase family protein n=1 Tax=Profundicola chukchiensis TaxID=2961959 RepID=UPI00243E00B0|nr:saccharopine dehydrogenase C-terminal domain-containing protein [Profundicola chukchiensis]MDG4949305.1 saccharopine dehydrogenase NADP-binding domain-containing protein [Profundicola chukchiensis]
MIKKIAVLGLGKVGSLVATLLSSKYDVIGVDQAKSEENFPFEQTTGDVSDESFMREFLKDKDAVVSCLPFFLNIKVAEIAVDLGVHYFDLTEDVPTLHAIQKMADKSNSVLAPQCGLAPGFIGIMGAGLYKQFSEVRSVKLRVGALPLHPMGQLGYSFTWSAEGVINEYINDAEVIHNGERKMLASLDDVESININGRQYEAFLTSGGLGTMCETLENKVDTLNYKTIRYPGHRDGMKLLLHDLLLKNDRKLAKDILNNALPIVDEDIVLVYAAVEGKIDGKLCRKEFSESYRRITLDNKEWRAISWTTACSISAVVDLVSEGKLKDKGFIKQEEIPFDLFMESHYGSMYETYKDPK